MQSVNALHRQYVRDARGTLSAKSRSVIQHLHDFFEAKSFIKDASAWAPSIGIAL